MSRWSAAQLCERIGDVLDIYAGAMGYPRQVARARTAVTIEHTARPGFRAVAALDRRSVVGFGYGYRSSDGQWWHEQVRCALAQPPSEPSALAQPPGGPAAQAWLTDAFELSELHVTPAVQGRGVGRALITLLLAELPERRVLLSTPEGPTRALALYQSLGFAYLRRGYLFPGDSRAFAVLGLDGRPVDGPDAGGSGVRARDDARPPADA
ncbi:MAG: GNAT family N-acetyltransferase [Mycobacteriales bacterium]